MTQAVFLVLILLNPMETNQEENRLYLGEIVTLEACTMIAERLNNYERFYGHADTTTWRCEKEEEKEKNDGLSPPHRPGD